MDADLKPCPFCGFEKVELFLDETRDGMSNYVRCPPSFTGWVRGCGARGKRETKPSDAISAWNSRAPDAEQAARIEELEADASKHQAELQAQVSQNFDDLKRESLLLGRVQELEAALRPFAAEASTWHHTVPDGHRSLCNEPGYTKPFPGSETTFTVGDLRRAAAALGGGE